LPRALGGDFLEERVRGDACEVLLVRARVPVVVPAVEQPPDAERGQRALEHQELAADVVHRHVRRLHGGAHARLHLRRLGERARDELEQRVHALAALGEVHHQVFRRGAEHVVQLRHDHHLRRVRAALQRVKVQRAVVRQEPDAHALAAGERVQRLLDGVDGRA
jgi:hypothetical protein